MKRSFTGSVFMLIFGLSLTACDADVPSITGISPVFGLARGGDTVSIRGQGLEQLEPMTIYFGNVRAKTKGVSRTGERWVTAPPTDTVGIVDVRFVSAQGEVYVIAGGFEYIERDDMAECVNISKRINGTDTLPKTSEKDMQ